MEFLAFLRYPNEHIARDNRFGTWFITLFWFGVLALLSVGAAFLMDRFGWQAAGSPQRDLTTARILCGVSLIPLLEEIMFRLPLKRSGRTILPALILFAFYFVSLLLGVEPFSAERLPFRAVLSLGVALAVFRPLDRMIEKVPYSVFFYGMALAFGALHLTNFDWPGITWTLPAALYLIWYVADKTAGGLLYGYARLRHGFIASVALHIVHNSPLLLLLLFR